MSPVSLFTPPPQLFHDTGCAILVDAMVHTVCCQHFPLLAVRRKCLAAAPSDILFQQRFEASNALKEEPCAEV